MHTADGTKLDYDTLLIFTLIEEDGAIKILDLKDLAAPEKRGELHTLVAQGLPKSGS